METGTIIEIDGTGRAVFSGVPYGGYLVQQNEDGSYTLTVLTAAQMQYMKDREVQRHVEAGRRVLKSGRVRRLDRSKH